MNNIKIQPSVVSTFASPHEPTLRPKAYKRASAFPAQVAHCTLVFADPLIEKCICALLVVAYSQPNQTPIPADSGHQFLLKADGDSCRKRTLILAESGQRLYMDFRRMLTPLQQGGTGAKM